MQEMPSNKPFHTIVLDSGPILKNEPAPDTLISQCTTLITPPSVLNELKDFATRSRVETFLKPFLTIRSPRAQSLQFVIEFAKKSGDFSVLSRTDLEVIALAYEIETDVNGSERLRARPGEKKGRKGNKKESATETTVEKESLKDVGDLDGVHEGSVGQRAAEAVGLVENTDRVNEDVVPLTSGPRSGDSSDAHKIVKAEKDSLVDGAVVETDVVEKLTDATDLSGSVGLEESTESIDRKSDISEKVSPSSHKAAEGDKLSTSTTSTESHTVAPIEKAEDATSPPIADMVLETTVEIENLTLTEDKPHVRFEVDEPATVSGIAHDASPNQTTELQTPEEDDDDAGGWITPANLKRHQLKSLKGTCTDEPQDDRPHIACMTTDFAMQNVLLQIGLRLLSPNFQRIRTLRTYILRCHACFMQVKDSSKQFCPRCGQPALTRVSCSTSAKGEFRIHLKKNMEWHHRGDRFSIPKPVAGQSNGRVGQGKGGGKGGWGQKLLLAEDQKEYQRAWTSYNKQQRAIVVDEDVLPGILTGDRGAQGGGRPKVGGGRNVNGKRRS